MEKEEAKIIEEIENEKNTTSLMSEAECYNNGLNVAIQIIKKHFEDVKQKILYDLEHPDLQSEKRYGFEGGLMYAREVIEKYL